ncbi:MAG: spermidine/putrescine ABC transporter substrate-binding protein [Oscillospiraceae bacterium]|nr:spermidine/putrescine ABC transporter substrate-binding protein [Oscillospiraceae bacterium]
MTTALLAEEVPAGSGDLPRDAFLTATTQATASKIDELDGTQLNLFTWEGMFPQDILDKFEADYGIRINYVNFDYDEVMLSRLQAAQGGDYDLIIADDYIIETVIEEGLAQKLDKSQISNFANIDPMYQGQFYDPADEYTVPYGAGVQTIVYDPSAVGIDITGYADLWDASLVDEVGIIANFRVINGMALKVLGKSYNTNDLDDIRAAGDKLIELAPNIRLIKDDQLQDDLLSGEISAAVMYTSQVYESVMENPDLRVVFPKEGIGFGVMAGFVPSKAPNPGAAHLFLNYILNEQISAGCFVELGYYSTNREANKYFAPEVSDLLILPQGFNTNMEMIENIDEEAEAEHDLVWTKFKTAAGQ